MMPNDFARSFGSVTSEIYACARERFPAVHPSMARATNSIHSEGANAVIRNPTKVPAWLTNSSGLRPV